MEWVYKTLKFGNCASCGRRFAPNEEGWHNYQLHKVRCVKCGPPEGTVAERQVEVAASRHFNPIGGSAALREARAQHDSNWRKGAIGEFMMSRYLYKNLPKEMVILNDREVPGMQGNIDHLVVAPSGIWIVDTKKWKGKIEYRAESFDSIDARLLVNGEDRTSKIEKVYEQVISVAQIVNDPKVPLNQAVVFAWGEWSTKSSLRLRLGKPYLHEGILITSPNVLIKRICKSGPLNSDQIRRLSDLLDEKLKPR